MNDFDYNSLNRFDNKEDYSYSMVPTATYETHRSTYHQYPPKKRKKKPTGMIAIWISLGLLLSTGAGFAGGIAASKTASLGGGESQIASPQTVPLSYQKDQSGNMLTTAQVAALTADTVVEITTETLSSGYMGQYISSGAGSGVIIREDGYIVTNNHVIDGANKITVTLRNGTAYPAKLIGTDPTTDIAVIKIEGEKFPVAKFGNSDNLTVGEPAIAIGNPLGQLGGTVTEGIISALGREIIVGNQRMTLLQTSAAINPGNSGGGLFNNQGELIGIVNAKAVSDAEGLGFAIPANVANKVVEDLLQHGYVQGRIDPGMHFVEISDMATAIWNRVSEAGVYIQSVKIGSTAETAGFQAGDAIIAFNGTKVERLSDLNALYQNCKVGDKISLQIIRGNQSGTLEYTLSAYTE